MGKSLNDVMKSLPTERQARIKHTGKKLIKDINTLCTLRKELGLTQEHMAELLDIKQANVSKMEQRSDILISTLRNYIEAMGGSLELIAKLPGKKPVKLEGFREG